MTACASGSSTRLACAWRSIPESTRTESDALSRQAVELARSLDDPARSVVRPRRAVLGDLVAREPGGAPRDRHARCASSRHCLGDAERMIDAQMMLWLSHTELADMTAARREPAEMVRLVAELRQPGQLWLGHRHRAR